MEEKILSVIEEGGSSLKYKTGSWRIKKPLWLKEKCKQCLLCALFCPELAIKMREGKREETNLDYCKGCGICEKVCPFKAIKME